MKAQWFKKAGWIYIPTSITGITLFLMTIVFCISVFAAVDRHSHSGSDTLYGVFPFIVSAFTILFWIASNTSHKKSDE